jgi:hypothetical protein
LTKLLVLSYFPFTYVKLFQVYFTTLFVLVVVVMVVVVVVVAVVVVVVKR